MFPCSALHTLNKYLCIVYLCSVFGENSLVIKKDMQLISGLKPNCMRLMIALDWIVHFTNFSWLLKFVFSKKATKFDKIFTNDLTLTALCQIDGEDFVNFCGLLSKHGL